MTMRSVPILASAAALVVAGFAVVAGPGNAGTNEQVFSHTGAAQTFTVPDDVCAVTITAEGAQGGNGNTGTGGLGGSATVSLAVAPGEDLQVNVGGQGVAATGQAGGAAGFNGGGAGGPGTGGSNVGGGGGGSGLGTSGTAGTRSGHGRVTISWTVDPGCAYAPAITATTNGGPSVTIDGTGFPPETDVTIDIESSPVRLGTITTTASGTFRATYAIPCEVGDGPHTIIATVLSTSQVATAQVIVSGCSTDSGTSSVEVAGSSVTTGPESVTAQPSTTG